MVAIRAGTITRCQSGGGYEVTGTIGVMPKPPMKRRSFHCPDKLWEDALAVSVERQENLADVLRAALERYVRQNRKDVTK